MNLSEEHKKIILDDFNFIIKQMNESKDIEEIIYFLSGAHGVISRVLNLKFDPHLVFIHFILSTTYQTILGRSNRGLGVPQVIQVNLDFIIKMARLLDELKQCIEKNESTYEVLEKISLLTYTLTGNGYFLQKKGIKIINF